MLLMQKHWEFQVVTPRNLDAFAGDTLVLPDVRVLSSEERESLKKLAAAGKKIVVTGQNLTGLPDVTSFADCPCRKYADSLDANLEKADPSSAAEFLAAMHHASEVEIDAAAQVATSVAMVDGKVTVFLANFSGLRGGQNPIATPQKGIVVHARGTRAFYLPFMGSVQPISGEKDGDRMLFRLPALERGGVVWIEP
jgi:hypothetical protein